MAKRSTKKTKAKAQPLPPQRLRFHYIKSPQFRTVHVDGVHGGISAQGHHVQFAVFNERVPIPKETVHPIVGMALGDEVKEERVALDGVVRELEVNLIMDLQQARSLADWLKKKADELEDLRSRMDDAKTPSRSRKNRN